MKVIVCGGRDFTDTGFIYKTLDKYHKVNQFSELIEGDARGVDRIAGYWARKNKINNRKFPANWHLYGKAAGFIRNREMIFENPELIIAFPGGAGTNQMISLAKYYKIPLEIIHYEE